MNGVSLTVEDLRMKNLLIERSFLLVHNDNELTLPMCSHLKKMMTSIT